MWSNLPITGKLCNVKVHKNMQRKGNKNGKFWNVKVHKNMQRKGNKNGKFLERESSQKYAVKVPKNMQ